MNILDRISGHKDLAALNKEDREQLCCDIREFLISHVSQTGGHLASNLGVVELTVALETVFDTEKDRLVFDVGHQSYVHKLLTGRQAGFASLRQFGGMAGFPKPSESDTDAFVAGHASSSVSIALGMARARTLMKEKYHVIALLGDGAATGGMAYEGMNDAADSGEPMIVILNDNEMSIDRNVGGIARHLSRLRTKERYLGMKQRYRAAMSKSAPGQAFYRFTSRIKGRIKRMILPTTLFENMGFRYLGPVDGHDVSSLISLFRLVKDMDEPVLVHVLTKKGHGCSYAEDNPAQFHGVGKFDPVSGEIIKKSGESFSGTFGRTLTELASSNERICAITAAMPSGTGLLEFKKKFPGRLFDVGIAEEHAVSMAGGLAKQGMIPVVALYSTFLQRTFDQIMQDVTMLHLHVVLAVDRAGLVGDDGETHQGIFDIGFLRQAPGMRILCPGSCAELSEMLKWAIEKYNGPVAVRYPRGGNRLLSDAAWNEGHNVVSHREGKDATILTYGTILKNAMDAAEILAEKGTQVQVLRVLSIWPLDIGALIPYLSAEREIFVVEETCKNSGIYEALACELEDKLPGCKVHGLNLGDWYVTHGNPELLYQEYHLDGASIANKILEVQKVED